MVEIISPQTAITPSGAASDLQDKGLDALGLTVPNISPVWSSSAPGAYDPAQLTLALTDPRAPFRGILEFLPTPTLWSDMDGSPLAGPIAVLRIHPEAARRLERLALSRYGTPRIRPVPAAMVMRGVATPDPAPVPSWFFAGDSMASITGSIVVSFHDSRGLLIDPIAVAEMFRDLLSWQPALQFNHGAPGTVTDPGGLNNIAALATGILCHVIDPHGWGYVPTRSQARLKVIDSATTAEVSPGGDDGLVTLNAGQSLGRSAADDSADGAVRPLRWGWALAGTLARTALAPPALPAGVTLNRQFFRVMAVDLDWHLLGNRTGAAVAGIPADDGTIPSFLLPQVRDPVPNFTYLTDGMEVLGSAAEMTASFPPSGASAFAIAVSPVLVPAVTAPPEPGAGGHWPVFPPPNSGTSITSTTDPTRGITATWRNIADGPNADLDVIVSIAADAVPDGAHVRLFPRQFVEISAIGETPSFVRGDGGSAIATAGSPTEILLINPFALASGAARPDPARVPVDIVVTSRAGQRRLFSEIKIQVAAGPASWTDNTASFGGSSVLGAPGVQGLLDTLNMRSVATSPLFGVPRTVSLPAGTPGNILDLVRRLASETQPRQGPRLPTQMRFESMLVIGSNPASNQPLSWSAVLSGARWSWEARASRPDLGNPGNPAGLDIHATGIRCSGWLAYDLALHAVKRAQPIVPFGTDSPSWLVATGGDNWNPPPVDTAGTIAGAMLETVAAISDTPELSLDVVPVPQTTDTIQNLVNSAASALGVSAPAVNVANADNLVKRAQREIVTAKYGQRDALWSLRRALGKARELVYIESATFARTARPSGAPRPYEIDLVDVIRQQMISNRRLKVIICVPRIPDFDVSKAPWVRTALRHRKEAIEQLTTADRNRVAAFHPIGFPGRPAAIRSTTVIVDDVWCMVGTSHFRRRGMTFDGAVDIVSIDRAIANGYSAGVRQFRQRLMAQKLGVDAANTPAAATSLWIRLAQPESAFDAVADLLQQGGLGRCSPVWSGPTDTSIIPQSDNVTDPNGATTDPNAAGTDLFALLSSLLSDG